MFSPFNTKLAGVISTAAAKAAWKNSVKKGGFGNE
jgi:hypothetical protein